MLLYSKWFKFMLPVCVIDEYCAMKLKELRTNNQSSEWHTEKHLLEEVR